MKDNLELTESGLQCDNPKCDWTDKTINFDVYKEWINKPCPKCGENVLTQEDHNNAEAVRLAVEMVNSMSEKELEEKFKYLKSLKEGTILDTFGESFKPDDMVKFTINTHKEIKITDIKKINEDGK